MSNKNSRKQKIKSIQKIDCERKVRNKELERLKNEAKFLEKKLYEQKKKN